MQTNGKSWNHGAYIRARRIALGLSQAGLARAARLTPAMINRLESSQRRGRPTALRGVAEALCLPAAELLERAGYLAEAQYWRERELAREAPDPRDQAHHVLASFPLGPNVRAALMTLMTELARDSEQEYRQRFDRGVKRYPAVAVATITEQARTPAEDDAVRFDLLRELLFEPPESISPIVSR